MKLPLNPMKIPKTINFRGLKGLGILLQVYMSEQILKQSEVCIRSLAFIRGLRVLGVLRANIRVPVWVLTLVLFLVVIISLTLLIPNLAQNQKNKQVQIRSASDQVPEMTELLAQDQETRLKAARALAERVGVEEALEIVEKSALPHTGEGHLAVHQIGFYAYQKYGKEAILHCKDYFLYACYHGAIIEAASDQGFPIIKQMTDICKKYAVRHFQCVHAAGHSINAIWDYDLDSALKTCDELYESETKFPEAPSSCHNGAFMENLFGVHDWGRGESPQREWIRDDDPYFPCDAFGEKYQRGCWLNQAARIYQMEGGDLVKTAEVCEQVENNQHRTWCMDNLARQIHPLTNGDVNKVFELCQTMGQLWFDTCVVVNAQSYYSVGGRDQGITICNIAQNSQKDACYQSIIAQIGGDPITDSEKRTFCRKIESSYAQTCVSQNRL